MEGDGDGALWDDCEDDGREGNGLFVLPRLRLWRLFLVKGLETLEGELSGHQGRSAEYALFI